MCFAIDMCMALDMRCGARKFCPAKLQLFRVTHACNGRQNEDTILVSSLYGYSSLAQPVQLATALRQPAVMVCRFSGVISGAKLRSTAQFSRISSGLLQ